MPIWGGFFKFAQFVLKSSAQNKEFVNPWRILLLLMPHMPPKLQDLSNEINLGEKTCGDVKSEIVI